MRRWIALSLLVLAAGCGPAQQAQEQYDSAEIETVDLEVYVEAAGVIEPETTVEVKSKASGEILEVNAETGDVVDADTLLVTVDKRTARNRLSEVEANLEAARARAKIAATQMQRAETLHASGTVTQADFEQTQLEDANAKAQVVSAEISVANAQISMEDTDVRAPITGTIIEKTVEPGMVISSPTQDVSGGSVLMKMADLTRVQVRTLVDEIDIGKIRPDMTAYVTVAAYPNQPFTGKVLKIEPQAIVEQNVTRFAVLIQLDNGEGLLMPGMNAEVEIEIVDRDSVSAIPTAALRADKDIPSTAVMLGLSEPQLVAMLDGISLEEATAKLERDDAEMISVSGRTVALPEGVSVDQIRKIVAKRKDGQPLSDGEKALIDPIIRAALAEHGGDAPVEKATGYRFGGDYWVIAMRDGEALPVRVHTGLTDLAHTEILAGLEPEDRVLLLPSSSLYEQQIRLQEYINRRYSSSIFQQQQQQGRRGGRR